MATNVQIKDVQIEQIQIEDLQAERRSAMKAIQFDRRIPVKDVQFKDFGVLNTGRQSTTSTATAVVVNLIVVALAVWIGAAAKEKFEANKQTALLLSPVLITPVTPPPPAKLIPVPELPKPVVVRMDPPKIKLPDLKVPDVPKPLEVKMTQPAPVIAPAAPKKIIAPPAPVQVNLAQAASVGNNPVHATAVALGSASNPIAPSNRPATAAVNLGQHGLTGMPSSNTGGGPAATAVNLGSGSPNSQAMAGNGSHPVQGVKLGSNGPVNTAARVTGQVNLGQAVPAATQPQVKLVSISQSAPKVLFKPTPAYTPEATALHVSGAVAIKIRVSATGSVTVLAITSPLGHGLDQSAERAIEGTRFSPAVDASGRPVDWEGVVRVNFQLAS